jgi:hypothetical protein
MKLGIMQPYLWPYIGYFQLIAAVDEFVVYDNIQYTKRGWINRNRMLVNDADATFTLPLASASDYLDVRDRQIADGFVPRTLLGRFEGAYRKAPHYTATIALVRDVLDTAERNLFAYLHRALQLTTEHLGIDTKITVSSTVPIDHRLTAQDKVLALCETLGASAYLNPIGGVDLYARDEFAARGVDLRFLRALPVEYRQFGGPFVPWLSIIDVLMFNPVADVRDRLLTQYELV